MRNSFILLVVILLSACNKYKDQTKPDVDDQLTRKYCNDPEAINYNDSFPGTPDNSTCIYAEDFFLGTWEMQDSIFKKDSSFHSLNNRDIIFTSAPDTNKRKMKVSNFSTCVSPIYITANNFKKAFIDNMLDFDSGQVVCSDTLSGFFKVSDSNHNVMEIEIISNSSIGRFIHKAKAIKK